MGKGEILSLSIIMFGFRFRWRWTYGSGGGGGWLMVIQLRRVRPGACTGQKSHWETEQPWILKVTLYLVYRVVPFKYHWDSEQRWMLLGPMKSDWVHTRYKSDGETQQRWILRLPSQCHKPLFLFHPHKSQVNIGENFPLVALQFVNPDASDSSGWIHLKALKWPNWESWCWEWRFLVSILLNHQVTLRPLTPNLSSSY